MPESVQRSTRTDSRPGQRINTASVGWQPTPQDRAAFARSDVALEHDLESLRQPGAFPVLACGTSS